MGKYGANYGHNYQRTRGGVGANSVLDYNLRQLAKKLIKKPRQKVKQTIIIGVNGSILVHDELEISGIVRYFQDIPVLGKIISGIDARFRGSIQTQQQEMRVSGGIRQKEADIKLSAGIKANENLYMHSRVSSAGKMLFSKQERLKLLKNVYALYKICQSRS